MTRRLLLKPLKMTMIVSRSMQPTARWLPYLGFDITLEYVEVGSIYYYKQLNNFCYFYCVYKNEHYEYYNYVKKLMLNAWLFKMEWCRLFYSI